MHEFPLNANLIPYL